MENNANQSQGIEEVMNIKRKIGKIITKNEQVKEKFMIVRVRR